MLIIEGDTIARTITVTDEQAEQIRAIIYPEPKVKEPWVPSRGGSFLFVGIGGTPCDWGCADGENNNSNASTENMQKFGNVFELNSGEAEFTLPRRTAFNNLERLAFVIGTGKTPSGSRWNFVWYEDGRLLALEFKAYEERDHVWHFPTESQCQDFITRGEKWLNVLYPKT